MCVLIEQQIIDGVYVGGGIEHAQNMITSGEAKPQDFRFFLQLCGWVPGQLQSEVRTHVCDTPGSLYVYVLTCT